MINVNDIENLCNGIKKEVTLPVYITLYYIVFFRYTVGKYYWIWLDNKKASYEILCGISSLTALLLIAYYNSKND